MVVLVLLLLAHCIRCQNKFSGLWKICICHLALSLSFASMDKIAFVGRAWYLYAALVCVSICVYSVHVIWVRHLMSFLSRCMLFAFRVPVSIFNDNKQPIRQQCCYVRWTFYSNDIEYCVKFRPLFVILLNKMNFFVVAVVVVAVDIAIFIAVDAVVVISHNVFVVVTLYFRIHKNRNCVDRVCIGFRFNCAPYFMVTK